MLNINDIIQTALSSDFEKVDEGVVVSNRNCLLYDKRLPLYVRGDHSYDIVHVYLVIDETENKAFLCYNPSIRYDIPSEDNEDYLEHLKMAAEFASDVTGYWLYINTDVVGLFGRNPLASDIEELLEISDENWFVRAIISYQPIIELMVYGYCKRTPS